MSKSQTLLSYQIFKQNKHDKKWQNLRVKIQNGLSPSSPKQRMPNTETTATQFHTTGRQKMDTLARALWHTRNHLNGLVHISSGAQGVCFLTNTKTHALTLPHKMFSKSTDMPSWL